MNIASYVENLRSHNDTRWSWDNYLVVVRDLIELRGATQVLEIGGGRCPSLEREQAEELGIEYTSNDISQRELARAPAWVSKACFDVQTPDAATIANFSERFDLVYSRMVMEHVADYKRAYRNIYTLLATNGVAIAHHPVLFSFPFLLNKALPQDISARILRIVFPDRTDEGIPKFPAHYSGCVIARQVRNELTNIGFRQVWQLPFYGHSYYRKFPVIRDLHAAATRYVAKMNLEKLAAFTYTIAIK